MSAVLGDLSTPALSEAARALASGERIPLGEIERVPAQPGVYAFWANTPDARQLLGLSILGAGEPMYIGYARRSLQKRVSEYVAATPATQVPLREWVELFLLSSGHAAVGEWTMFPSIAFNGRRGFTLPFARKTGADVRAWMQRHLAVSAVTALSEGEARALEMPLIDQLAPSSNIAGMKRHFAAGGFGSDRFRPDAVLRMDAWNEVAEVCRLLSQVPEEQRARQFDVEIDVDGTPVAILPTGRHWEAGEPLAMAAVPNERTITRSAEALAVWFGGLFETDEALIAAITELLETMDEEHCWMPAFTMAWMSQRQWHFERSLRPLDVGE